jgi:hypothetical protein
MEAARKEAYAFLLSAAMLHLKWDLVRFWHGLGWWTPWRLPEDLRRIRMAAHRAVAFHNLAVFLTLDMEKFNEDTFWREIEEFSLRFPEAELANYRGMFEKKLAGQNVLVIKPGG